jgi:N-acetylmuramic acid 6-phosphate etherase
MSNSVLVAVDVGKTGARCAVWADGAGGPAVASADAPGLPGLAAPGGVAAAVRRVRVLLARASFAGRPARIGMGIAGALTAPDRARDLADALAGAFPGADVAVASDAVTAHCGALGGRPGIVATLGTGVSVLALAPDGCHRLVDGAGPWIGDFGSGAQIGRDGIRAVLRARENLAPATELVEAARRRFGHLADLAAVFAGADNPARLAASFAPEVARCAAAGDEVAARILDAAAADIAGSIRTAQRAAPETPVVLTGGLVALGAPLLDRLAAALPDVPLGRPEGDAIAGAARLAAATTTAWEPMVTRAAARPAGGGGGLDALTTEQPRPDADRLEELSTPELVDALLRHEREALDTLPAVAPALAAVIDAVAARMAAGGRLIYVGAGTPGRLAYLDAAECEPTFGIPAGLVVAVIAGGEGAVRRAVEGAEDDADQGARDVRALGLRAEDSVVGIAASGRTPYVLGALRAARDAGVLTVGVANNLGSELAAVSDSVIEIDSGPEVLTGSTRLAAGTTQKITLNTLSTGVMIRLGKTYRGRMVDVLATNAKLRARVVRIVRDLAGVPAEEAAAAVAAADGETKTALVALLADVPPDRARQALAAAGGRVADALAGARR